MFPGWRKGIPNYLMENIPLQHALLTWNPANRPPLGLGEPGDVEVFLHPVRHQLLDSTAGACETDYQKSNPATQLATLYRQAWHAVIRDGIDPQKMHNALLDIPEFRRTLAEDVRSSHY